MPGGDATGPDDLALVRRGPARTTSVCALYREDILRHAYALARANAGAPGTDGMTFAAVEASYKMELKWLA